MKETPLFEDNSVNIVPYSDNNEELVVYENKPTVPVQLDKEDSSFEYPYDLTPEELRRLLRDIKFSVATFAQYEQAKKLADASGMNFSASEKLQNSLYLNFPKLQEAMNASLNALGLSLQDFPYSNTEIEELGEQKIQFFVEKNNNPADEQQISEAISFVSYAVKLLTSADFQQVMKNLDFYTTDQQKTTNNTQSASSNTKKGKTIADFMESDAEDISYEEVDPNEKSQIGKQDDKGESNTDNKTQKGKGKKSTRKKRTRKNKSTKAKGSRKTDNKGSDKGTNEGSGENKKTNNTGANKFNTEAEKTNTRSSFGEFMNDQAEDIPFTPVEENTTTKTETTKATTEQPKNETPEDESTNNEDPVDTATAKEPKKATGKSYDRTKRAGSQTNSTKTAAAETGPETQAQENDTTPQAEYVDPLTDEQASVECARIVRMIGNRMVKSDMPRSAIRKQALQVAKLQAMMIEAQTRDSLKVRNLVAQHVAKELGQLMQDLNEAKMTKAWNANDNTAATEFTTQVFLLTRELDVVYGDNLDELSVNRFRKLVDLAPFEAFTNSDINTNNLAALIGTVNISPMDTYQKARCHYTTHLGLLKVDANQSPQDTVFPSYVTLASFRWTQGTTINSDIAKGYVKQLFSEMKKRARHTDAVYENYMKPFAQKHNLSQAECDDLFGVQSSMEAIANGDLNFIHIKNITNADGTTKQILSLQPDEFADASKRTEIGEVINDSPNFFYCKPQQSTNNEVIVVSKMTGKVVASHLTKHGFQKNLDTNDYGLLLASKGGDKNAMSVINYEGKPLLPFAYTSINVVKNTANPKNSLIVAKDTQGDIALFDLQGNTYFKNKNITAVNYVPGQGYEIQTQNMWSKIMKKDGQTYFLDDNLRVMKKQKDGSFKNTLVKAGRDPEKPFLSALQAVGASIKDFFRQGLADLAEYPTLVRDAYYSNLGKTAPSDSGKQDEKAPAVDPSKRIIFEDSNTTGSQAPQDTNDQSDTTQPTEQSDTIQGEEAPTTVVVENPPVEDTAQQRTDLSVADNPDNSDASDSPTSVSDISDSQESVQENATETVLVYQGTKVTINGKTINLKKIVTKDLEQNPNVGFVFRDDAARELAKGQAKQMRGQPNALGIATSHSHKKPFTDSEFATTTKAIIDADFAAIEAYIAQGKPVVFPQSGVGTGSADLQKNAPETLKYINKRIEKIKTAMKDAGLMQEVAEAATV